LLIQNFQDLRTTKKGGWGGGGDEGPNIHGSIPPWKEGYHTYSLRIGRDLMCTLLEGISKLSRHRVLRILKK
jgi:hypothetical protein